MQEIARAYRSTLHIRGRPALTSYTVVPSVCERAVAAAGGRILKEKLCDVP